MNPVSALIYSKRGCDKKGVHIYQLGPASSVVSIFCPKLFPAGAESYHGHVWHRPSLSFRGRSSSLAGRPPSLHDNPVAARITIHEPLLLPPHQDGCHAHVAAVGFHSEALQPGPRNFSTRDATKDFVGVCLSQRVFKAFKYFERLMGISHGHGRISQKRLHLTTT